MSIESPTQDETTTDLSRPCSQLTAQGEPCQAWAVHGSDPPLCSAHAGRNVGAGAPVGNQNRLKHGFYSRSFRLEELEDVLDHDPKSILESEIACARVALQRVMAFMAEPKTDMQSWEYAKLASLVFYGTRTVARLVREHKALGRKFPKWKT